MSDNRESLARLLYPHVDDSVYGTAEVAFKAREAANAILAEFLVIPRTDIAGTEYGARADNSDVFGTSTERRAMTLADWYGLEAVERPVLPWSSIPLPEDGQPCETCGGTGTVACWSPGGPCQTSPCEACGPCTSCRGGDQS